MDGIDEIPGTVPECALCPRSGKSLLLFADRGRRVCESCLMAGVEDDARYALENELVTVKAR